MTIKNVEISKKRKKYLVLLNLQDKVQHVKYKTTYYLQKNTFLLYFKYDFRKEMVIVWKIKN